MSFASLGLSDALLKAVSRQKYEKPYPIQEEAIPAVLAGKDIFGIAQTGSGKTAGYVLPILQLLQRRPASTGRAVPVVVLVPTRELAAQVAGVFQDLSTGLPRKVKTLAVYGGVSINPQMMALKGTDVLVATPGRLLDLQQANSVQLNAVEILVLDEADKMLNLGFKEEVDKVLSLMPSGRQNLLFSATAGDEVTQIKERLLKEPHIIEIAPQKQDIELIKQVAYNVSDEKKGLMLRYLIKSREMKQVLVFVSSTHRADHVVVKLKKNGIDAAAFHGKLSQGARMEALNRFKSGKLRVLVATDLASRGIDIQFLPFVINYELPRSPTDYVHRIGRTGRAESPGEAISLIVPEDQHHFKVIQKKMKKQVAWGEVDEEQLKGY